MRLIHIPERSAGLEERKRLLKLLADAAEHSAYVACDGSDRKTAWELEELGYATWKGESWGSQFYTITDEGLAKVAAWQQTAPAVN